MVTDPASTPSTTLIFPKVGNRITLPYRYRGKKGLGYQWYGLNPDLTLLDACDWYTNWSDTDYGLTGVNAEFVPMLWGDPHTSRTKVPEHYTGSLLLWNEPNQEDQADISPYRAAALYIEVRQRFPLAHLVTPACITAPRGIDWMARWVDAVFGMTDQLPDVAAVACHAYFEEPAELVSRFYETFARPIWGAIPIWVTEWRVCPGPGAGAVLVEWMQALHALPYVAREAYFSNRTYMIDCDCALWDYKAARLTALGEAWASVW